MAGWFDDATRMKDDKRRKLEADGYTSVMAMGAVKWAYGTAKHLVPPEQDPRGFLEELATRLDQCPNWIRGYQEAMSK